VASLRGPFAGGPALCVVSVLAIDGAGCCLAGWAVAVARAVVDGTSAEVIDWAVVVEAVEAARASPCVEDVRGCLDEGLAEADFVERIWQGGVRLWGGEVESWEVVPGEFPDGVSGFGRRVLGEESFERIVHGCISGVLVN